MTTIYRSAPSDLALLVTHVPLKGLQKRIYIINKLLYLLCNA